MLKLSLAFGLILCLSSFGFALKQEKQVDTNNLSLKILKQPSAQQSDIGLENIVEGKVQLRVEFLSTGEIGEVTLFRAKKKIQKSGCVEAATNAAKRITFEPAKKGGKTITVVKVLEYTFSKID